MTPVLRRAFPLILLAFLFCAPASAPAQEDDAARLLTPERLYVSEEFDLERFGPARWLEDGSGYTILEDSDDVHDRLDVVRYDPVTGKRDVLVSVSSCARRAGSS